MSQKKLVSVSIIISGLIIAGALMYVGRSSTAADRSSDAAAVSSGQDGSSFGNNLSRAASGMRPIDGTDHVRGNPDARIAVVEYSDFECPFCRRFHPTLVQLLEEFPDDVKWVYRHLPLLSSHPRALGAAVASECAAKLGGNDAFWKFSDRAFGSQHSLGSALYSQIADDLEIDKDSFDSCLKDKSVEREVFDDLDDARRAGGHGTPYSVIVDSKNGSTFPFSGALPIESIRSVVLKALES